MDNNEDNMWKKSLNKLKNVNFWKDTELPSNRYTAIASFTELIDDKIVKKGACLNINSTNTIASYIYV